ncbi:MAG: hypothetical protein J2P48_10285 [Alphaproteobacteria bacterium]|nr:hypothetical protein [Alphaproteobacteria bacterium]
MAWAGAPRFDWRTSLMPVTFRGPGENPAVRNPDGLFLVPLKRHPGFALRHNFAHAMPSRGLGHFVPLLR